MSAPPKYRPAPLPFRHARRGESGTPFFEYVESRMGSDRRARIRMLAFVDEWEVLADEIQRTPTAKEFSVRWNVPLSTVYDLLEEFRRLFPTETDPGRLIQEIWDGVAAQQSVNGMFMQVNRVLVIPTD